MRKFLASVLVSFALILAAGGVLAQTSCQEPSSFRGNENINIHDIDLALFDRLILEEVNHQRCLKGISAVSTDKELLAASLNHAYWMASVGKLSHQSEKPGHFELADRMYAANIKFTRATENLARVTRYKLDMSKVFRVNDKHLCSFSGRDGRPIPQHSYRSLARYSVQLWMSSPGHARNLFDPDVQKHAAALQFDSRADHCGDFYIAQNFKK